MIALNIFLMIAVTVGIVSLLAWAIASDRRNKRARSTAPVLTPLTPTPPLHKLATAHQPRVRRAHSSQSHRAKAQSTLA